MKLPKSFCACLVSVLLAVGTLHSVHAQSSSAKPPDGPHPDISPTANLPTAASDDVSSIQNIVKAFYRAISAPAGGKLDRNRLRSLFVPSGRIVVGIPPNGSRSANVIFISLDEYADRSDSQTARSGFFDANPANQIEQFGVMAHVYSTYESRTNADDAKPMARGIKSFELLHSGGRWYILQVYWDSERPDNPLPERYLHDGTP